MSQTNGNNWIYWTLGSVAVATLGVGAFLYFRQRNKSGKKNEGGGQDEVVTTTNDKPKPPTDSQTQTQVQPQEQVQYVEVKTNFNTKEQGDAFRRWVRAKDPNFAQEIDLSASGDFDNSYIRKAYGKYGNDFQQKNMSFLSNGLKWIGSEWKIVDDASGIVERYYESGDANNGARISFDRNGRVYIQGRKNGTLGSKWKAGGWYVNGNVILTAPMKILINGKEYTSGGVASDMKNDKVWQIWNDGGLWSGSNFTPFADFVNMIDSASSNDFQDETL
jgi:hypothetical protein